MKMKKPEDPEKRIQTVAAVVGAIFTVLGFLYTVFKG